ncbi:sigma-70 family RNA polymerase sigma factor [Candidatus Enterococcus ikei]|uniref:Sigma-70 family RNA polymerase sigma factor n=1 Tax=Candidatus Enterococcus ikei TaxID=2815326 RepID=A0ABS3H1Q8_9ENTE|nr:sigma-70 family RNA polymerase sigma factor [Enterococcus sp. DIV0869a]MBO0441463.1 sigma-70 family RNA polymerase sigma factor [Enterococcus sp. DIV0869a]
MANDVFLVKKAQKGNQEAFIQLIQGYEIVLYNMARRFLSNEQDIADVLQETVITAYQKIDQLKNPKYFNTWICRIMINHCKKLLNLEPSFDIEDYPFLVDTQETEHLGTNDLLLGLKPIYRIPLVLYYYNGFSVKEISEILTEPTGTNKSRLARGRALLQKEYIGSEGGTAK